MPWHGIAQRGMILRGISLRECCARSAVYRFLAISAFRASSTNWRRRVECGNRDVRSNAPT
eukprot:11167295-Lingulodinium_polyedra.AAC.1